MAAPNPTEGELAILRVLWARKAPMTVREVHAELSRGKDTAYTTVLKMLTIMADKGLVKRDESERSHTYLAVHAEPVVQRSLVKDLVRKAFGGIGSCHGGLGVGYGAISTNVVVDVNSRVAERR
jgi:predicted transcriptional regulator